MSGAVTMKMMRRTSITSTSGVTLISVSVWRAHASTEGHGYPLDGPKKWRRTMLRKSLEKLVISLSSTRIFEMK